MNLQHLFFIGLTGLFISYYISEYTHITHTDRVLSRKFQTKNKKIDSISTRKIIGTDELQVMDPFLRFTHYKLKKSQGLLDHPHSGYDTITYILSGHLAYEDFRNNSGILSQGDAQWITTGKGLVHAEIAESETCEILQIWLSLKLDYKLCDLVYQNLLDEDIIKATNNEGVTVKILSGESLGRWSYTITRTQAYVLDAILDDKALWQTDIPAGWNCMLYILYGEVYIEDDKLKQFEAGMLSQWDTDLTVRCVGGCRVILIAGEVLDEMIVNYGQFFMPNYPMVEKASRDYKTGKDGFEGSLEWRSKFN